MTMPHLINCQHSGEGWCLSCVKELHDICERDARKSAARKLEERAKQFEDSGHETDMFMAYELRAQAAELRKGGTT